MLILDTKEYYYPDRIYREANQLRITLENATTYEDWHAAALRLDNILPDHYAWKHNVSSSHYSYRRIRERLTAIHEPDQEEDVNTMDRLLRSGLERNYGGIMNPMLYDRLYGGTKFLIEQYVDAMVQLLDVVVECSGNVAGWSAGLNNQFKMNMVEGARKTYGRTALVLQGGSIFGLYHLGVMRELNHQGLLPRIILGTATGALMAALVAIYNDDELAEFLNNYRIILEAFEQRSAHVSRSDPYLSDRIFGTDPRWFDIFESRMFNFWKSDYVLDRDTLEQCINTNVGDMTFEEAFKRNGRLVSITISCDSPGTPNCLNYITTPNVLIRTAARASNEADLDKAPSMILEKSFSGEIRKWSLDDETPAYRIKRRQRQRRQGKGPLQQRNTPLYRVAELWNVNHFVISQARPYLVPLFRQPFNRSQVPKFLPYVKIRLRRYIARMLQHRLRQFTNLVNLPRSAQRLLTDENIPGPSITLKPDIGLEEMAYLFRNPTKQTIDHWVMVGQKSVWPCISALQVRCDVELALERHYQYVRRHPPRELLPDGEEEGEDVIEGGIKRRVARPRSGSMETNPL